MTQHDKQAKAANIFDVARLAGVSHQTVSRVINDLPNVRPATRDRVVKAIAQLRYVPSPAARALVTKRSRVLGLVSTGVPSFSVSTTAVHFTTAAREARYAVSASSMVSGDATSLRAAIELLLGQKVEAIVVISDEREALEVIQNIELGVPLVAVASELAAVREDTHQVAFDQFQGASLAVEHLIELGHREIRHVSGAVGSMNAGERERGWRAALADAKLPIVPALAGDWSPASGYEHGLSLAGDSTMTAVFVASDEMALGVMHGLQSQGRRVPEDVSVMGFDDIPLAAYVTPPLSTVRLDFATLGRDAFSLLLSVLQDEDAADPTRRMPALIRRASTAPPAGIPVTQRHTSTGRLR
ncbi:LacI family DNA-binding transcriptional regulator [Demequina aurantiaca]|uniref:LacI family DNA-binding transcriptional regulator n=1 Tax=Demequina aurantiaca TaxID=676200 RepID=UPI000783D513|nr:LacI family DNA-binding transcriptional regulator [Demequina aurantiaca]